MEIDHGYLTITATKEQQSEEHDNYIRKERFYGQTKRSFYVGEIDEDEIHASFENGTLKVVFKDQKPIENKKQITID